MLLLEAVASIERAQDGLSGREPETLRCVRFDEKRHDRSRDRFRFERIDKPSVRSVDNLPARGRVGGHDGAAHRHGLDQRP